MLLITELHLICFPISEAVIGPIFRQVFSFIIADFEMNPQPFSSSVLLGQIIRLPIHTGFRFLMRPKGEAFGKCPAFAPCFSTPVFRSNDMTTPSGYVHTYFYNKASSPSVFRSVRDSSRRIWFVQYTVRNHLWFCPACFVLRLTQMQQSGFFGFGFPNQAATIPRRPSTVATLPQGEGFRQIKPSSSSPFLPFPYDMFFLIWKLYFPEPILQTVSVFLAEYL